MTGATAARRLVIAGRVQGVGYRAWAIEAALRHGLRGWVRNMKDGKVEALVIGTAESVADMIETCRRGPPTAHVIAVMIGETEDDGSIGFTVRPTG